MKNVIFNDSFRQKGLAPSLPGSRPPIVAVTGGIACGKSTFGQALADSGAELIDTDEIVHQLQRPGQPIAIAVRDAFGPECLHPDGSVNRPALAQIVFHNPAELERLNALSHPLVKERVDAWCTAPSCAWLKAVLIPLLFESGWDFPWTWTLCIACSRETQMKRLLGRGLSKEDALRRIAAQASPEDKAARSDIILRNDGTLEDLRASVAFLKKRILK